MAIPAEPKDALSRLAALRGFLRAKMRGFIIRLETNEGHVGEFSPFMGGTEAALGEVRGVPLLLACDRR